MVLLGDKFDVLPEAIKEGQRILNGMQDVMRLFLTTPYATLLIIIAGFIDRVHAQAQCHPDTLPVGLPAFVSPFATPGHPKRISVSVSEFILPAGFSIMVTLVVYLLYQDDPPNCSARSSRRRRCAACY